jgi:hypothetical protein
MGERRNACRILMGKPERKRPLGKPRCRWMDIKKFLREVGRGVWTRLIWFRIWTIGGLL